MEYVIVLKNLKNGCKELTGLPQSIKPTDEVAERCRIIYGAEGYEIKEVGYEIQPTERG